MNLSFLDMSAIGVHALIGAVIAGLYSVGVLYSDRRAGTLLSVPTYALHVDRILLSYCRELERRTKHLALLPFLQVIDAVDRIVSIRVCLQERKEPPNTKDEKETFFQLARVRRCLKELVFACKSSLTLAEQVDLENLCSKLLDHGLESHIKTITLLTKDNMEIHVEQSNTIQPHHMKFFAECSKLDPTTVLLDPNLGPHCQNYIFCLKQQQRIIGFVMAILLDIQIHSHSQGFASGAAVTHILIHPEFRGQKLMPKLIHALIEKSNNMRPATYYFLKSPFRLHQAIPTYSLLCILDLEKAKRGGYQVSKAVSFIPHDIESVIEMRAATFSDLYFFEPGVVQICFSEDFFSSQSPFVWTLVEKYSQKLIVAHRIVSVVSNRGQSHARVVILSFLHATENTTTKDQVDLFYAFLQMLQKQGYGVVHAVACGILAKENLQRRCRFQKLQKLFLEFYLWPPPSQDPQDYVLLYV